jgi:hypothetical protein
MNDNSENQSENKNKPSAEEKLQHASIFKFDNNLTIEYRGSYKWAVCQDGMCYSKDGFWEFEPMPSGRGEQFLSRTRYDSLDEACKILEQVRKNFQNGK